MSAHIVSTDAHAAVLLCERFFRSSLLGLDMRCEHDAEHAGDCGPRESSGEVDGDAPYESFICDLLVFGSRAWTDKRRIAYLLETVRPYSVIEGEANGADAIARNEAMARDIVVRRFPVDNAIDGAWPAAGHKRNARMYRDGAPSLAAGFVTGKVGSPLSKGSEGMASVIRRAGKVPLAIYREDGIEPLARADEPLEHRLAVARGEMLKLHHFAPADVKLAGVAVRAALDLARGMYDMRRAGEAVMAARSALEALRIAQPRLTPWLYGVEALLV